MKSEHNNFLKRKHEMTNLTISILNHAPNKQYGT